jgi:hypothetical protein
MPMDLPPPRVEMIIVQEAHAPIRIPQVDLAVEVVGTLPLQTKLQDVSRLLGLRLQQPAGSFNRHYPPAILELITLVERNPAKPRGGNWDAVDALTIRYHTDPRHVVVEYCIDYCDFDPRTGAFNPRRKMVSYHATEELVEKRLDKKLEDLKKYSAPPFD